MIDGGVGRVLIKCAGVGSGAYPADVRLCP